MIIHSMELKKVFLSSIASLIALTLTLVAAQIPLIESHKEISAAAAAQFQPSSNAVTASALEPPAVFHNYKRVSWFLAAQNPRAADHCNKDNSVCNLQGTNATTCCNNKCIDVQNDDNNCGACKNKCKFREACCGGKCVSLAFDEKHCGQCNSPCKYGRRCVYGLCGYA